MTDIIVRPGGTRVVVGAPDVTKVGVRPADRAAGVVGTPVRTVATVEQPVVAVASLGVQGPAGPPGPDGSAAVARIAAVDLGGHRVVRALDATRVGYADRNNPLHGDDTLGVTEGAATAGGPINVRTSGALSFAGWAWTPGEPVLLGSDGMLTQEAPDIEGFWQVVGFAQDATTIFVGVQPTIYF